ncbi:glycosyltransferase family 2 protein [Rhodocytophaga rosea]|uniref:Glycosyltransferase family 2 protein n=1 Tax=Rhodocytophaga rosea TaxID=2704465 RepID=A0A6C0GNH7_9BACT|nr:glycosyltransferase family 2 protein [Rhodocytophaga rosea]QHT69598.1 glycosyltransferase family 2 protein [Rhodocytophaga rosea]
MILSVIIPTYNRVGKLEKCIESLSGQSLANEMFEIIVIDNASTDTTREVIYRILPLIKNLSYIYESTPGLNEARNRGLKEARGLYIAYLDDDTVTHKYWAEKIVEAFSNVIPQPGVVGGPVLPVWEGDKPYWLTKRFEGAVSMINYGSQKRFLQGRDFLVGANMAFLKAALVQIGGFLPGLDRKGSKLLSGGDIAAIEKIKKLTYQVYYDPDISVDHYISTERLNHEWFIKRSYWEGYSEALMWRMLDKPSLIAWSKKLIYYIYGFLRNPGHIFYLLRSVKEPELFWFKCMVHARVGYLAGLVSLNK